MTVMATIFSWMEYRNRLRQGMKGKEPEIYFSALQLMRLIIPF
jgi:hypothetical protein